MEQPSSAYGDSQDMMSALPVVSALLLIAVRASALQAPQSSGFLAAESGEHHRYPLTLLQRATAGNVRRKLHVGHSTMIAYFA